VIDTVLFVAVVITVTGLPLAHWAQRPPYTPWRRS
jgi:hypothetical protein